MACAMTEWPHMNTWPSCWNPLLQWHGVLFQNNSDCRLGTMKSAILWLSSGSLKIHWYTSTKVVSHESRSQLLQLDFQESNLKACSAERLSWPWNKASDCPVLVSSPCSHHLEHVRILSAPSLSCIPNIKLGKYCIVRIVGSHFSQSLYFIFIIDWINKNLWGHFLNYFWPEFKDG